MIEIAVILGSTRPGRTGIQVARWVMEEARQRTDARYTLIDLLDHPLPHLDEPIQPAKNQYTNDHTRAWSQVIEPFDGFVFVTPEYNHAPPGVLKNAIDYLYREWNDKAATFVGYGGVGATRAVQQLRLTCTGVEMATTRAQVALSIFHDFEDLSRLAPTEFSRRALHGSLDRVVEWSGAFKTMRANRPVAVVA